MLSGISSNLSSGGSSNYLYFCRHVLNPKDALNLSKNLQVIGIVSISSSFLSVIGAGSIVVYSVWKKVHQVPEVVPLLHLSAADLILSVLWMVSSIAYFTVNKEVYTETAPVLCFALQLITEMIHLVTFFLTLNYAVNVLLRMVDRAKKNVLPQEASVKKFLWLESVNYYWLQPFLYGIAWLLPLVLMLPLAFKVSTKRISACQKCIILVDVPRLENVEDVWRHYGYYLLVAALTFSIASILVSYFYSLRIYWNAVPGFHTNRQRRSLGSMQKRVTLYILVFLICWSPALVLCAYKLSISDATRVKPEVIDLYGVCVLQALLAPLQGFLNSIVYGWSRKSFRLAVPPEYSRLLDEPSEMRSTPPNFDGLSPEVHQALDGGPLFL